MLEPTRYRIEEGAPIIDVRVRTVEQMFDNRDPAPFRDRDLDPALAEYLLDAGEDLLGAGRIRVVFWLVYDWIPAWHRRRIADKLLAAAIDVRTGSPAAPT